MSGLMPPRPARARSVVRMLTTAGPTFSTSSVKSGKPPCAHAGCGATKVVSTKPTAMVPDRRMRANAERIEMESCGCMSKASPGRDSPYLLCSSPLANAFSVVTGTSPTTVIHQSPWRRISVCVAPIVVSIARVCLSGLKGSMNTDT